MRYIAKKGGWFNPGSEVKLEADCGIVGAIFSGIRISESDNELHAPGEEYQDEEMCTWDEVEAIDECSTCHGDQYLQGTGCPQCGKS